MSHHFIKTYSHWPVQKMALLSNALKKLRGISGLPVCGEPEDKNDILRPPSSFLRRTSSTCRWEGPRCVPAHLERGGAKAQRSVLIGRDWVTCLCSAGCWEPHGLRTEQEARREKQQRCTRCLTPFRSSEHFKFLIIPGGKMSHLYAKGWCIIRILALK